LEPPETGREGWKEIFATNVYLRTMFNPEDGLEVNGAQGEFLFAPAEDGRYAIAEWWDLPRPSPNRPAVEPATWGAFKATFKNLCN
jgi:hypothetical protein